MSDETVRTPDAASPPRRITAGIAIAALMVYLASPGPVVGLLIRLKMDSDPVQEVFRMFNSPLFWLGRRVQFIDDFYNWYVRLFGG